MSRADECDWGMELDAVVEAIVDTMAPSNPMVTNESGMAFLSELWRAGWRVVPLDYRRCDKAKGWHASPHVGCILR